MGVKKVGLVLIGRRVELTEGEGSARLVKREEKRQGQKCNMGGAGGYEKESGTCGGGGGVFSKKGNGEIPYSTLSSFHLFTR